MASTAEFFYYSLYCKFNRLNLIDRAMVIAWRDTVTKRTIGNRWFRSDRTALLIVAVGIGSVFQRKKRELITRDNQGRSSDAFSPFIRRRCSSFQCRTTVPP